LERLGVNIGIILGSSGLARNGFRRVDFLLKIQSKKSKLDGEFTGIQSKVRHMNEKKECVCIGLVPFAQLYNLLAEYCGYGSR
jgi:hypothetical protein